MAKIKQLRVGKDDLLARYLQYLENKVKNLTKQPIPALQITAKHFPLM